MTLKDIIITNHIINDRADRIAEIQATGGIGELALWLNSREEEHIVHIMTTTNIILVIDKYTNTCLTLYKANDKQLHVFHKYGTKIIENNFQQAA